MAGKRASPGIGRQGHNSGLPSHADVRAALAIEMIFAEEAKKLRERHKRARKRIEGMGVRLDDLSFLKALEGKTGSEVVEEFKRHWHLVGAIHEDKHEQLDIFAPKPSAPEIRAAHYTMGLLRGLKGEELEIPPMVVGDDRQQMIDGHNEGMARRQAAWDEIGRADGQPVDGTGKKPSGKKADAEKVNEQAAGDFAKDQGEDPLVVNGERYPSMRAANAARERLKAQQSSAPEPQAGERPDDSDAGEKAGGFLADPAPVVGDDVQPQVVEMENGSTVVPTETEEPLQSAPRRPVARPDFHEWPDDWKEWSGSQTMEFRRWFESLPEDSVPAITHQGAVTYFNLLREEQANRASGGPDDDEWDAAAPARQEADLPDPAEVEAAAKKLQENGFVEPKKTRRGKKA